MAKQNDAQWVEIDPSKLDAEQQTAYRVYKDAYATMKGHRKAFEELMGVDVAEGQRMIFGYNFGKLSVAIVVDDRKAAKPKQAKMSLSEYMALQQAIGQRC